MNLRHLLILFFILIPLFLSASQKMADEIANISSNSLGYMDKVTLKEIIDKYVQNQPHIMGLKITENLTKEVYINLHRKDGKLIHSLKLPSSIENYSHFKSEVIFNDDLVGHILLYVDTSLTDMIQLTKEEKLWLDNNSIIISVDDNYPPMNYLNKQGKMDGLTIDYLKLLESKIGKPIKLYTADWPEALAKAMEHKTDGIVNVNITSERSKKLLFTNSYITVPMALFTLKEIADFNSLEDLAGKTVLVKRKTVEATILPQKHPQIKVIEVETYKEALSLLSAGKAIGVFGHQIVIQNTLKQYLFGNIKLNLHEFDEIITKQRIGVRNSAPELHSILNKALANISNKERLTILEKWGALGTTLTKNMTIQDQLNEEEIAFLNSMDTFRVNLFDHEPPLSDFEDGKAKGYINELLELAVSKIGKEITWIPMEHGEAVESIKTGKIDIFTTAKENMGPDMVLKTQNYFNTPFALISRFETPNVKSLNELGDKTVVSVKGFLQSVRLQKNYPNIKLLLVENVAQGIESVRLQKADYYLDNLSHAGYLIRQNLASDLKIAGNIPRKELGRLSFAYGVAVDKPMLRSILDKVLASLSVEEINTLKARWLPEQAATQKSAFRALLTQKENEWLKEHPVITMCIDPDWMPFEEINKKGEHVGISAEIFALAGKRSGIKFDLVPTKNRSESLEFVKKRKCDILPITMETPSRKKYMNFTSPYFSFAFVIATRDEELFIDDIRSVKNKPIGIVKGLAAAEILKEQYPQLNIKEVDSVEDGLKQLQKKKLYGFIDTVAAIAFVMQQERIVDIKIAGKLEQPFELGIATRNDEPTLNSIMQKVIDSVSENEKYQIYNRWFTTIMEDKPDYLLIWKIALFVAFVFILIVLWNILLKRKVDQRTFELVRSEDRFRSLVEQSSDWIWEVNAAGVYTYVSPNVKNILGYTSDEIIGKTPFDLMLEDDVQRVGDAFSKIIEEKRPFRNMVNSNRHKNGDIIILETSGNPILDKEGNLTGYLGVDHDITDRHQYQELLEQRVIERTADLAESERRLKESQGFAKLGQWVLHHKENRLEWSDEVFNIFEIDKEKFGASYEAFLNTIHPEDREAVNTAYLDSLKNKTPYEIIHRLLMKDGRIKYLREQCRTEFDNNEPIVSIGTVQDITTLKEQEEEVRRAKDEAEKANKAKTIFLANMSHELRTPMNAILGFSNILERDSNISEEQREKLNIINRSGEHLMSMINDILDLSKIEAGKILLDEEPCDLISLLEDISAMFKSRAGEKGLTFILNHDELKNPYIMIDRGKVRQILINLLGNALKFTESGEFVLNVKTEDIKKDNKDRQLIIEVSDTGPGIESSMLKKIFKPFTQAISSGREKGTGLGLSICKSFVDLMDGEIEVQSELGKGSIFRVTIPVTTSEPIHIENGSKKINRVIGLAEGEKSYKILVVDDDLGNRLLLKHLHENIGFNVLEANNGAEAIDIFKTQKPDFIWMDMRMPVMDGYEATSKIRKLSNGDKIPIVALTASAIKEQRGKIIGVGCDEMVSKPYKEEWIFDTLKKFLGVNYTYEESSDEKKEKEQIYPLNNLPQEIRDELKNTALLAHYENIISLVKSFEDEFPKEANTVLTLAKRYSYDEIINLLEQ